MALRDDLIVRPSYTHRHWMRALKIPLGQFWVGSHWLRVEAEYHIPRVDRTYQLCHLQATVIETEEHFIFRFPIYYEIEGQYYHVFRDSRNSLSILFQYPDQRFIALFMKDALGLRSQSLRPPPRPDTTRMITSLITVLPAYTGTKRHHQSGLVQS